MLSYLAEKDYTFQVTFWGHKSFKSLFSESIREHCYYSLERTICELSFVVVRSRRLCMVTECHINNLRLTKHENIIFQPSYFFIIQIYKVTSTIYRPIALLIIIYVLRTVSKYSLKCKVEFIVLRIEFASKSDKWINYVV